MLYEVITPINPLSLEDSIAKIETFFAEVHAAGIRPIGIGGDHTIPIPILRGSRFSDHDLEYGYDVGYTIITMDEYEDMGRAEAISYNFV